MARGKKLKSHKVSATSTMKTYPARFDFPTSIDPQYSPNSITVLETRYLEKDQNGNFLETPKEMIKRVASNLATADYQYGATKQEVIKTAQEFYDFIAKMEFNPNTPCLVNAGRPLQMLSACFVLPVGDSMEEIFDAIKNTALIHKAGGGTGFAFSRLRPYGDFIQSTTRSTSGPLAFLEVFNTATNVVKQGGVRRGANMGILNIHHPDVLRFIVAKINEYLVVNFNLSVGATHAFFYKIDSDKKYIGEEYHPQELLDQISELTLTERDQEQVWRQLDTLITELEKQVIATHEGEGYDIINPRNREVVKRYNAAKIFDLATRVAWRCGDPGMVNLDNINESPANPVPVLGPVESTNPCGEQPLYAYDSCNLGSINLGAVVTGNKLAGERAEIDWAHLERNVKTAVHLLDNVIDMNKYPIEEIAKTTRSIRRIGLGVMGWADMLVKLGIAYDSQEALELGEQVMQFINEKGHEASMELAEKRGPFPMWEQSIYCKDSPYFKGKHEKLRNATVTTIAPTGTISMIAGCSYGIEPFFGLAFTKKNILGGKQLFEVNPLFLEVAKKRGFYSEELMQKVSDSAGAIREIEEIPEDVRRVFVVSREIPVGMHVKMQAAFQKYTDNAVSKTINLPNEATVADVQAAYKLAYTTGCKGITIYRDGSREKQVVEVKAKKDAKVKAEEAVLGQISEPEWKPRRLPTPVEAWGFRLKKKSDVGTVFTSIFRNEDGVPVEVFINVGKAGGYVAGAAQVTGRLSSLAMKYGASIEEIANELVGISCGSQYGVGPNAITSMFDAVGKSIHELIQNRQLSLIMDAVEEVTSEAQTQLPMSAPVTANMGSGGEVSSATNGRSASNGNGAASNGNGHTAASSVQAAGQASLLTARADPLTIPTLMAEKLASGTAQLTFEACPECGGRLFAVEGCMSCVNPVCGYSKCG